MDAFDPPSGFQIRLARSDDAEAIETVRIEAWKTSYRGIVPDQHLDRLAVTDEQVERWHATLADPSSARLNRAVAESGGRVVGFVMSGSTDDDALDSARIGEVHGLYVSPDRQGRGIGRALMAQAVAALRASRFEAAVLWTLRDHARSRRFYERNGWTFDGAEHIRDMGGPVALVRYARDLDDEP